MEITFLADEEKVSESKVKIVTLKELGNKLPHGIVKDGKLYKNFEVSDWGWEEELRIGELKKSVSENDPVSQVSVVLKSMLISVGPHEDFQNKSDAEKDIIIGNMTMADVFYAYFWLRRQCIGYVLPFEVHCSKCSESYKFNANIDTLEVKTVDKPEDALWEYKLEYPVKIRDTIVTYLSMGPNNWFYLSSLERSPKGVNAGKLKRAMFLGSVFEYGELGKVPLAESEINGMRKIDIEGLIADINELAVGADMVISGQCPKCTVPFEHSIQWWSESFFTRPSSPDRERSFGRKPGN